MKALADADSVALDPHKWPWPLEAGCALVRNKELLRDAFAYHPPYYPGARPDEEPLNYHSKLQNSRGFRALKVWLGLLQSGRDGCARAIRDASRSPAP